MKCKLRVLFLSSFFLLFFSGFSLSEEVKKDDEKVYQAGEVQVSAKGKKEDIDNKKPEKTVINTGNYITPGNAQNITDILKDLPLIDFRGATDLIPDDDTIYLRGFGANRFVTAMDGVTLRKTGGRKSSHIVDYALLPVWLLESIEVLPGPHSALYPGKGIGGVLNMVSKEPREHLSYIPEVNVTNSYSSYNTQHHNVNICGGVDSFTYDIGYEKYATDGYLRHTEADIDTIFGRFGYLFNSGGFITLSMSYTDADRDTTYVNDPDRSDYDSDYPTVKDGDTELYEWQSPTWDKHAQSYKLYLKKPSSFGIITAVARYSEENRDREYIDWVDKKDHSKGISDASWDTKWKEIAAKVQDEIKLSDTQILTVGTEIEQCYDGYGRTNWAYAYDDKKRIEILSGYAQHEWNMNHKFKLTTGLRYEDVTIQVGNVSNSRTYYISGRPEWIERNFGEILPKMFLTWDTDDFSKDSSLSLGISRIWRAPDYHGDYNPQGRPAGAWLDPEHGIGYDLIFSKKFVKDLSFKINYSYYEIWDYIATNSTYADYTPSSTNTVNAGEEYKDYKINLDKVIRHGVEVQLNGNITESLSFYLGYSFQKFINQGDEPAGETELDDRPENKFKIGIRYKVFKDTVFIADYEYESDQVIEIGDESSGDWEFEEVEIDSYHLLNIAVQHTFIKNGSVLNNLSLKVFINNCLDEDYMNVDGYPGTDRTFGATLKYSF